LTLAFALASAPAVLADSHEGESFDPASVEEWNQDETLILYQALENRLLAMGVAQEDMDAAMEYLQGELANLSEEDLEDLAEASAAMGMMEELTTEDDSE
jgi:rRNA maturation endonuclease Nob1